MDKTAKKVDVEYKLGELNIAVKQLNRTVEGLSRIVQGLSERLEKIEEEASLEKNYIVISRKQLFGLLGTILGSLGSLIYYVYLIAKG